jgi:uncharacterized membrane protein YuzA (DUF378 family)
MNTDHHIETQETTPFFNIIGMLTQSVIIVGALNWGFVALKGYSFVEELFGTAIAPRILYLAIGVAGIIQLIRFMRLFVEIPPTQDIRTI